MSSLPSVIGRYEIRERLGQGGMGVLYLAFDPAMDRLVALKLLKVHDADLRERFLREARLVARLQHPNIVRVYDVSSNGEFPFMTMEYVAGDTLDTLIRMRAPLTLARKIELMIELCDALSYAHRTGVIHRDIKPSNLMVHRDSGLLCVLDFGIARTVDSTLTLVGAIMGTPNYMSPEQIEGRPIDCRSDVFAVGAVCYELLASRPAFRGDTPYAVLTQIVQQPPVPLTTVDPSLDPALQRILDRAMAKDPVDRYPDLDLMRRELSLVLLRNRPVTAETLVVAPLRHRTQTDYSSSTSRATPHAVPPPSPPPSPPSPPPAAPVDTESWKIALAPTVVTERPPDLPPPEAAAHAARDADAARDPADVPADVSDATIPPMAPEAIEASLAARAREAADEVSSTSEPERELTAFSTLTNAGAPSTLWTQWRGTLVASAIGAVVLLGLGALLLDGTNPRPTVSATERGAGAPARSANAPASAGTEGQPVAGAPGEPASGTGATAGGTSAGAAGEGGGAAPQPLPSEAPPAAAASTPAPTPVPPSAATPAGSSIASSASQSTPGASTPDASGAPTAQRIPGTPDPPDTAKTPADTATDPAAAEQAATEQRRAIRRTLSRLADAYSTLDVLQVVRVWPTMSAEQGRRLQGAFKTMSRYTMSFESCRIVAQARKAHAVCAVERSMGGRDGRERLFGGRLTVQLERRGSGWVVVNVPGV